jgi:hypothetical protein
MKGAVRSLVGCCVHARRHARRYLERNTDSQAEQVDMLYVKVSGGGGREDVQHLFRFMPLHVYVWVQWGWKRGILALPQLNG